MRIVFAGTPEFARLALSALLDAGHQVPLVLTQPDRPSGRGLKLTPSPVKQAALAADIPVAQPRSLRLDGKYPDDALAAQQALQAAAPDLMVVAAYGLILPEWVLSLPSYGCFNIHASLLPRWRGAAPIQRAIQAGDAETGVTIMLMDQGLDTGAMLATHSVPISMQHTAATLHDDLASVGAHAIVQAIADLKRGVLMAQPQPDTGITYAEKLDKAEAALDFNLSAVELERRIRAFDPVPGSTMGLPGLDNPVKVWRASVLNNDAATELLKDYTNGVAASVPLQAGALDMTGAAAGTILQASAQGIDIATGQGVLRLLELQKAGGKRQPVAAFMQGWNLNSNFSAS